MARMVALLQAWTLSRLGIQPTQTTSPVRKQHRTYRSVNIGITRLKACTHVHLVMNARDSQWHCWMIAEISPSFCLPGRVMSSQA